MAEAEQPSGGSGVSAGFVFFVLVVLFFLWIRQGGWARLQQHPINFGWKPSATSSLPFETNFTNLAPKVSIPTGPQGPQGPDPYNR